MTTKTENRTAVSAADGTQNPYGFNAYEATGIAEGFIECDDEEKIIGAWQFLHDTRIAYQLQGWFGRTVTSLIEQGYVTA